VYTCSARVTCRVEVNQKRCGDGDEVSYVGYARVNSSVFSLALKVPTVLAVLVFTVSWFQTVGAATEKVRDETEMVIIRPPITVVREDL